MPSPASTSFRPSRCSRARLTEHAVPAVLVVLLLLMAGLVIQSVLAERARRATGAEAMRQFSGIAAWRFANGASEQLHDIAQEIAIPLSGFERRGAAALPGPEVLMPIASYSSRVHVIEHARLAFRLEIAGGLLTTSGGVPPAGVTSLLTQRLPHAAALGTPDTHRTLIDTAGGQIWGVVYRIVRDSQRQPLALFGWVIDGEALTREFATTLRAIELLPTALAGPLPQSEMVSVRVAGANGMTLFERGDLSASPIVATDTMMADQGGYLVSLALAPALGARLLLGPATLPQWWTFALLGVGVLLAALAMQQLHRGRELARLRDAFVANVSHELRTPLAQVSLFSETLMHGRERSREERRYMAEVIYREAGRLTTLVEGILRFSRAGIQPKPALAPHDLSVQLREVVEQFAPIARANGANIELDAPTGSVAMVDPGSLRQIVLNLLDNAVKYGASGQRVWLSVHRTTDVVRIAVTDEGPGIPRPDRERVFEPFTRLSMPDRAGTSGTGIGLAVVRELAEAMGGSASAVEPESGYGAAIVIELRAPTASPILQTRSHPLTSHAT